MAETLKVFIASASGALDQYRTAARDVCTRLGLVPVCMDDFTSSPQPPINLCLEKVAACDAMVLILGHRYGTSPSGFSISYTEIEFSHALENGLSILAFCVNPEQPWPPLDVDEGSSKNDLEKFVKRVRSATTTITFQDVSNFRELLIHSLIPIIPSTIVNSKESDHKHLSITRPRPLTIPPYIGNAPFTGRKSGLASLDQWDASATAVLVIEAIGGTGKSALAWSWFNQSVQSAKYDGYIWFSFYEEGASLLRLARRVNSYAGMTSEPGDSTTAEQFAQALDSLQSIRMLVVLDGFERLLAAYHQIDPTKIMDEAVEHEHRSLIDASGGKFVRELTSLTASKVMISTRLMPAVLESRFHATLSGVDRLRLAGLDDSDVIPLLQKLGVNANPDDAKSFFGKLDNHPLLIGIVAGIVRDFRAAPGDFREWLKSYIGGAEFRLSDIDLWQRRTHILASAMKALDQDSRTILNVLSAFSGPVEWHILRSIFVRITLPRATRTEVEEYRLWLSQASRRAPGKPRRAEEVKETWRGVITAMANEPEWAGAVIDSAAIDSALANLEDRGLLWWDRQLNCYDLHPIIRSYVFDSLNDSSRRRAHAQIRDYFSARPTERISNVRTIDDLRRSITLYRALLGTGQQAKALELWHKVLFRTLTDQLGNWRAVVELLEMVPSGSRTRLLDAQLVRALRLTSRSSEAFDIETATIQQALNANESIDTIRSLLANLTGGLIGARDWPRARRALILERNFARKLGRPRIAFGHGLNLALALGCLPAAERLFQRAESARLSHENRRNLHFQRLRLNACKGYAEQTELWKNQDELTFDLRQLDRLHHGRMLGAHGQFAAACETLEEYEDAENSRGRFPLPVSRALYLAQAGSLERAKILLNEIFATSNVEALTGFHCIRLARAAQILGEEEHVRHALTSAHQEIFKFGNRWANRANASEVLDFMNQVGMSAPRLPAEPGLDEAPFTFEPRLGAWLSSNGR